MKKLSYVLMATLLSLAIWFCANKRKSPLPQSADVSAAAANSSDTESVPTSAAPAATNDVASYQSKSPPADVLSATNLEQWKSLIKDLKQDRGLQDNWMTSRYRPDAPPVLLKHDGQSIAYKAEAIDVTTFPKTSDFMEAQIYSPKMNMDETLALGMNLCSMFGFDSNKLISWCDAVGTNWLNAPAFVIGDRSHAFNIRFSYNNEKPWYIIFTVQDPNAVSRLRHRSSP